MTIDTSRALAKLARVELYAREGWKPIAAEVAKEMIRERSAQGLDADGNTFPQWSEDQVYSPEQKKRREKAGLTTDTKTMSVRGDLLGALQLRTIGGVEKLAVAESPGEKLNRIMHGQMYHPAWRYHHKIVAVSREMMMRIRMAVAAAFPR